MTLQTSPDRDAKGAHHRPLDRQLFLVLQRHALEPDRARAVRTPGGHRGLVDRVDLPRHTPRGVELLCQLLVFSTEPLPLGLRSPQILFELLDAPRLIVNDLLRITRRINAVRHALVMPDLRAQYKRILQVSLADPLT